MSFFSAIEMAERQYTDRITTLTAEKEKLATDLKECRELLADSTNVCSKNTYMLGMAIALLKEKGVSNEEIARKLGLNEP